MATSREDPAGWLAANREMWDERAPVHGGSEFYDLHGLAAGGDHLRPWEDVEVGPVAGKDLIHLQCHIGTDTVGWARRGARVTGLDFSASALTVAADLARRCGVDIEWIAADVHDAAEAAGGRTFDVVYTGIGALGWLPDLGRWSEVVSSLLRPGGFVYVLEIHPMWIAHVEDGRTISQDAIAAPFLRWDAPGEGSYAAPQAVFERSTGYERLHALSDLFTAVLDTGLAVELFHEFDVTPAPTPWLVRGEDRLFRFPPGTPRFPVLYSLRARKPAPG